MKEINSLEIHLISGGGKHFYAFGFDSMIEEYGVEVSGFVVGAAVPCYLAGGFALAVSAFPVIVTSMATGIAGTIVLSAIHSWGANQEKQYLST